MLRILHLSDVHFGRYADGRSAHRFAEGNNPLPHQLAEILCRDALLQERPPNLIIISGDIGWSGKDEDYRYARRFLDALKERWGDAEFVLAPGNHDFDQSAAADAAQVAFLEFIRSFH